MIVISSRQFKKKVTKLPKNIRAALKERLRLFLENPHHPVLNNHPLHGSLRNYRSINITGDYRMVFEGYTTTTIRLIDIDTHDHLYDS